MVSSKFLLKKACISHVRKINFTLLAINIIIMGLMLIILPIYRRGETQ